MGFYDFFSFFVISVQMYIHDTGSKLKNIIAGAVIKGAADSCRAIRNFLCTSFSTSTTAKTDFESKAISKEEQAKFLKQYARNRSRNAIPTNNYYNKELGLILEDIHDENVIVNSNTLFFIDTVFYTAFT
jgi:hypothetical protein